MEVFFFLSPKNWVPAEYSYFFLIILACLAVAFIVRFFINKVSGELGKVESIFEICIIATIFL